jgi:hypothetical protein
MERNAAFGADSRRFSPGSQESNEAHKVRRGKIGGFEDYVTPEQVAEIDHLVNTTLAPGYGYGGRAAATPHTNGRCYQ